MLDIHTNSLLQSVEAVSVMPKILIRYKIRTEEPSGSCAKPL